MLRAAITQRAVRPGLRILTARPCQSLVLKPGNLPLSSFARPFSHQHHPSQTKNGSEPDVYYHFFDQSIAPNSPSQFAVSFLPEPPKNPNSPAVVGWLPPREDAGLNDFTENPQFRHLLHRAIQTALEKDLDDIQRNRATTLGSGWMHIHDERNIPDLGRIGDPEDIIATVLVENSKVLSSTYQPMPAYRVCTSNGLTQVTPGLKSHLLEMLRLSNDCL